MLMEGVELLVSLFSLWGYIYYCIFIYNSTDGYIQPQKPKPSTLTDKSKFTFQILKVWPTIQRQREKESVKLEIMEENKAKAISQTNPCGKQSGQHGGKFFK